MDGPRYDPHRVALAAVASDFPEPGLPLPENPMSTPQQIMGQSVREIQANIHDQLRNPLFRRGCPAGFRREHEMAAHGGLLAFPIEDRALDPGSFQSLVAEQT